MKLRTKFILFGVTAVTIVAAQGAMQQWSSLQMTKMSTEQALATAVVQRHMESDMMHDAINGNILGALVASANNNPELLADMKNTFKENYANFTEQVTANVNEDLPEEVRAQLVKVSEGIKAYEHAGLEVLASTDDFAVASAKLPGFTKAFKVLEVDMGETSDKIVAWADQVNADSNAFREKIQLITIAMSVFSILVALSVPTFALFSVFRPQIRMAEAMSAIAGGYAETEIPYTSRKDEMGELARTAQVFKDNALRIKALTEEQERQKAEAEKEKRIAMHKMADGFESSVQSVVTQVTGSSFQMQASAESMSQIAADTKQYSSIVANSSGEVSQTSAQVAAAAEELSASIKEISAQTQKSNQIAGEATAKAESAKHAIQQLAEKSARVDEIIEVITGIAGQINLLALNATIESARVGEAGKGFAVVASEVKNLANQVTKASDEITHQIGEMQGATQTSVDSVMEILQIINEVSNSTSAVAAAVEEQSAATNEIAQSITRTSSGTQEISQNIGSVLTGADQTGVAAKEVLTVAKTLGDQSNTLKNKVDEFLATIRAG